MYLEREKIIEKLNPAVCNWQSILVLESTGSTNKEAYDLAMIGGGANTVIMTEYQTAGRGRMNRSWEAGKGNSILFSIILRDKRITSPGVLMLTAAASLRETVAEITGRDDVLIKWPNDVFIGAKKCCGILAQAGVDKKGDSFYVLGIGLNVNNALEEFSNLPQGTSLFVETGHKYNRNEVAAKLFNKLSKKFGENIENILAECRDFSYTIGREVCVDQQNKEIRGKAVGIDDDGFLIVLDSDNVAHKIICGDVL